MYIDELVGSWSQLEGRVEGLGSLVSGPAPLDIPLEQLEQQLVSLRASFTEKQIRLKNMEDKCRNTEVERKPGGANANLNLRRMTIAPTGMARNMGAGQEKPVPGL